MQHKAIEEIVAIIKDADMILVGIGEEFDDVRSIRDVKGYEEGKMRLAESSESSLIPAWQQMFREQNQQKLTQGLQMLAALLRDKNYFVVSVSTNNVIAQIPWREGRLVMPCGTSLYKQCSKSCEEHLRGLNCEEQARIYSRLQSWHRQLLQGQTTVFPEGLGECPTCKTKVELNNIYSEKYDEEGYLPAWQLYTKWLQGTLNKKLVILELGVGMKFPSVIRFPFEKVGYFNQKAKFYRINQNLYHLTEELAGKGVGIADNAIDWLQNLC